MFGLRLEIGLVVTAVAAPFVRPTIAKRPSELCLKAAGLCLVLTGLGVRAWAAGFAGRHTRSSKIEGSKLATAGPYAHVRNPIYLGSVILGFGIVLLIGDRRLWAPCALTFLALYFGLIPAEEEFLSQKFQGNTRRTAGMSRACFHDLEHGSHLPSSRQASTGGQPTASAG
jgi:protein-S-isoprenylcysteine O-methyltransferase Ste14